MRRVVIKNRLRFTLFLLTVFMLFSLWSFSVFNVGRAYSKNEVEYISYIVDNGDTLWEIAQKNNPDNKDVRKLIYEIQKYNNIGNSLSVGQEIKIPL